VRRKQQQPKKPLLREAKPEKAQHLTKQIHITGKLRMGTHATGTEEGTAGVIETGQTTGTKGTDRLANVTGQPCSCVQNLPGCCKAEACHKLAAFCACAKNNLTVSASSASGIMQMSCMQGHLDYEHLVALIIIPITVMIMLPDAR